MSRPKEFDRDTVIHNAMQLFWAKGYEGATLPELLRVMGLSRSSFYNEFIDKESLFLDVIDFYFVKVGQARVALLNSSPSVKTALRAFFEAQMINDSPFKDGLVGCLITNTAVAVKGLDPIVACKIKASAEAMEQVFLNLLQRGQTNGEIATNKDIKALAKALLSFTHGMCVYVKIDQDRAGINQIISTVLSLLD
ncbi:TetR/AcrR family transcriptional regulator [Iodobacter sp. LRB]|uniref:TetR/AcrR family transcriptional regulator n=1 Tax=unclassified Iodobacter TaxID=235634 RepID=UPI000C1106B8|nr:TetR/AcrR family transcriptional regulator [Iodobacter sp. BJB302]PHU99872.1 TetR family transcriptional regulator [Iodobacter sp. BJB302]